VKSLEAELMDWADDITFSVHDLVDFYCAGRIPFDQMSLDAPDNASQERVAFLAEVFERNKDLAARQGELTEVFSGLCDLFTLNRRYIASREQRTALWQFITALISRYADGIRLAEPDEQGRCIRIDSALEDEIRMLKELTWHYVILQNELATEQHGQRRIVESVFKDLRAASNHRKDWNLFPAFFKEALSQADGNPAGVTRVVADYVSSMTEKELIRTHHALSGRA
jgi:dGTPase